MIADGLEIARLRIRGQLERPVVFRVVLVDVEQLFARFIESQKPVLDASRFGVAIRLNSWLV